MIHKIEEFEKYEEHVKSLLETLQQKDRQIEDLTRQLEQFVRPPSSGLALQSKESPPSTRMEPRSVDESCQTEILEIKEPSSLGLLSVSKLFRGHVKFRGLLRMSFKTYYVIIDMSCDQFLFFCLH
jgi:hypothetical protein